MNSLLPDKLVCQIAEHYGPGSNAKVEHDHGANTVVVSWHDDRAQCRRCISMPMERLSLSYGQFLNLFADDVAKKYYNDIPREIRKQPDPSALATTQSSHVAGVIALKHEVMMLAQWLSPGEAMTVLDANTWLRTIVSRICAQPGISPVVVSLIAVRLAEHIEAQP